ncbi:KAP family P-loop NTPase fold protein [Mesorhizobium sp. Cs1321R2N1]|uniref:KAP family P-loop NTPase fold protein n=1 Tax=Mesorhizobium sp. Cs1321R2N1 TaxID=3015174 RepID=UPI00301BC482
MASYFNDSPIETAEDDRYGMAGFAMSIANSILRIKNPVGTTIALNGPWGSGKSSAVNLIRSALREQKDDGLVVTDFKCWWYRGEEALALAFLQNLNGVLRASLGNKVKDLVPRLTQRLLQAGPVIGTAVSLASGNAWATLIPGVSKFASIFFPDGETVEKTFRKLAEILEKEERRFLVVIDDIDRLNPEEAIAIFRLVKSIGRLPNVMYLLVFDRELAEKAVLGRHPSEGPHFLEKIIQAGFELPAPLPTDLNNAVLTAITDVCGEPVEAQVVRIMNVFYDVVAPHITTPRHVARFHNAISVTWPAIAGEVSLADFIALETLRLYEPGLFKAIRSNKSEVCGVRDRGSRNYDQQKRFDLFLDEVPEVRHELAKTALQRLFPKLEEMGYGYEWIAEWDADRRVCVEAHFDTYFRLSLSDEALSSKQINELVERADDANFIKEQLRHAAKSERRNGRSMVPVYLDELRTHAKQIEKSKAESFLRTLFEIHDEIDLEKDADRGFNGMGNTSLRVHWLIRRLTRDRFTLNERSDLYLAVLPSAALGWLVDFVSSARRDHLGERQGGPTREEDCLVTKEAIEPITAIALRAVRGAAGDGSLLQHPELMYILYRWRDFLDNDAKEVRAWTDERIKEDSSLVALARELTGKSYSFGMGGFGSLGDRVSKMTEVAHIGDDTDVIDPQAFRRALERVVEEAKLDPESLKVIRVFLDAWDRKRSGERD